MDQEYKNMCNILEYCYAICHDDNLGILLGALSIDLFLDGAPADLAIYDDWLSVSSCNVDMQKKINLFLEMYEKNYGFNFKKTKEVLSKMEKSDFYLFNKTF